MIKNVLIFHRHRSKNHFLKLVEIGLPYTYSYKSFECYKATRLRTHVVNNLVPNIDTGKLLRSVIHTIVPHHDGPVVAADVVDGEEDALVVFVFVGLLEIALDKKHSIVIVKLI